MKSLGSRLSLVFGGALLLTATGVGGGTVEGGITPGFGTGTLWHEDFCYGEEVCMSGDFNGDGKDDAIAFVRSGDGDVYVALSNGDSFDSAVATTWNDDFCYNAEVCTVGDFNGDGNDDIVAFTRGGDGDVYVALSTGTSFETGALWDDFFCFGQDVCGTGDFDGNGSDDIYAFEREGFGDVFVALSTGTLFSGGGLWHDNFCYGEEVCTTGDFDGDGKDDIVAFTRQGFGDVYVALATGVNFGAGTLWFDDFCYGNEVCTTGDFDGDGMDDLVAFTRTDSGDVFVARSTGTSFVVGTLWNGNFCYHDEVCGAGNFDGEGGDDIVTFLRQENPTLGAGDIYVALSGSGLAPATTQGDVDCDDDVDTVDALKLARHVAALAVAQEPGCPEIGNRPVRIGSAGEAPPIFGDVDCDSDVDAVDALKVLRHVAGLAITQTEPCPDIGAPT